MVSLFPMIASEPKLSVGESRDRPSQPEMCSVMFTTAAGKCKTLLVCVHACVCKSVGAIAAVDV